ncbi:MAG TPA: sialidase [Terriglobia bacterium]|nr:sialidase [Terriglobia bacterium]
MQQTKPAFRRYFQAVFCILLSALQASAQYGQRPQEAAAFKFRFVGPAEGNRIAAVAGVAGDPSTYYAGAASGGIWKSSDGGNRWVPIFDHEPVAAIGALAVAPSDPNVIWAGTGEPWVIRDSDVMGNGVYKSVDAGKNWAHMGLEETGRISRVVVDPRNPDTVFVCALGRATGPQQERGVFRTTDGGQHWDRVLFADPNTGCSGMAMDPRNPRVLFAGMWQVELHTWGEFSGGPGSGIYVSRDGGVKWTRLDGQGLPKPPVGKIDLAVAPTDSSRVYALIQTRDEGSVWRSDDGGENWHVVSHDRTLIGRAGYYIRIAVSTGNENEVYISNSSFFQSLDGGENFHTVHWQGGDNHDIWVDPLNPDRFVITDDGGMRITTVHGRGFHRVVLPIGQMYHVAVDNQIPYDVYSNMQDDGNMRGPNNSEAGWDHEMGGCESGFTLPDPTNPDIVWATCYGNEVSRWDAKSKMARSVSPWMHTLDSPPNQAKYRCHWTAPLAIDPFDHNSVYYGCQVIFKTSNGGQSWSVISPDLSTQDPAHNTSSGGLVGDNLGQFYAEVVFSIAPSPIQKNLIWAGTNDGLIWNTKDGGEHWSNVTKNISGLPPWGSVTCIQPSFFEAGTAYVSVDFHLADNRDPFIFKTTDFGQTWTRISGGLPKHPLGYVRTVTEDPNCKGLLFAGTGNGLYYSLDEGGHWTAFQEGLPPAPVTWAVVQKTFHDLVVSTYGRGLYVLDDITPLEQMARESSAAPVRFFVPRSAYRTTRHAQALLNFWLKSAAKKPVQIEILDSTGHVVRKIKTTGKEGINRAVWDMHYEPPRLVALRTGAPDNPNIWDEPRFRDKDSRAILHWGTREAEVGPIVAPGKFTVRLTVDGQTMTQPLTVVSDPRAPGSNADIEATVKLQLRIRDDISKISDMVNQVEWARKQLDVVIDMLHSQKKEGEFPKSVADMGKKMLALETTLVGREQLNSDDKYFVESLKPYFSLIWLNGEVGTGAGDVAGGANFAPTDTTPAILMAIEKDLSVAQSAYHGWVEKEVPAFNRSLAQHGISPIVISAPVAEVAPGDLMHLSAAGRNYK